MSVGDYAQWSHDELIAEVKKLTRRKKFGLVWEDRAEDLVQELNSNLPVIERIKSKSVAGQEDAPNHLLIEGDNLHALQILSYTHQGLIDLIYIDPPYNTGNKDFRYNDVFVEKEDSFRHSKWLSFMSRRLKLAKGLLSDAGVIFMSIDENEFAHLKLLGDEIFDERNYVMDIIWNSRKSVSSDAIVSLNHNHTLVWAKDIEALRGLNKQGIRFKLPTRESNFANPDNDPRGPWAADPFDAPGIRPNLTYPIKNPNTGESHMPPNGRCWRTTPEEYSKYLSEGRIIFGKTGKSKPQLKRYLSDAEARGMTPKSLWDDVDTTTNGTQELETILGEKKFNNPKPLSLLLRILELGTDKNSIVLDFMAGSGTTGHAVLEQNKIDGGNRKFILATNNENEICEEVTFPRIRNVMQGYTTPGKKKIEGLGGNLWYFKSKIVSAKPTDSNKYFITKQAIGVLCIKESCFEPVVENPNYIILENATHQLGILFGFDHMKDFKIHIMNTTKKINVYVFSLSDDDFADEFEEFGEQVKTVPIPKALMSAYVRSQKLIRSNK